MQRRLCPYWSKKDTGAEYSQRCPLGLRCPYSHGAKEMVKPAQHTIVMRIHKVQGEVGRLQVSFLVRIVQTLTICARAHAEAGFAP